VRGEIKKGVRTEGKREVMGHTILTVLLTNLRIVGGLDPPKAVRINSGSVITTKC
jgi:hypothetical protein